MNEYMHASSQESLQDNDKIEVFFKNAAQIIISLVFGFLPLLFVPLPFIVFDYGKVLFVVVGFLLAFIFYSLSVLRSGRLQIVAPVGLWAFWGVAIITVLSALLSGDTRDALIGDFVEVHTALFVLILALVVSITAVIKQSKVSIMRLYIMLTISASLLALFHVLRLVFGADFLSLGILTDSADSTLGGWNDLALFFGLTVLLSIAALEQLPLTKWGKVIFGVGIALSLVMLSVINFFAVWIVLGLVSLIVLMYSLTKDRFAEKGIGQETKKETSLYSIILSALVFVLSLVFVVGGSGVSAVISEVTDISYVEVRPSFEATVDIGREVYAENAFLGIGPNKFTDAWRLYKDQSINQTIFWSVDFRGGSGYIPTLFVTTGIFGVLAWVVFLALFLLSGFRMLFKSIHVDRFWYFIGSSSFIAATYLWGMAMVYVPGATILLLAALFTSITFASYGALMNKQGVQLSVAQNKRAGLVLVGAVMVVIVGASCALYYTTKHFGAVYTYASAVSEVAPGTSIEEVEQKIVEAYTAVPNDLYARQLATYQLAKINTLLALTEPTPQQQQEFQQAIQTGINAAQLARQNDVTDPRNWAVLGSIYSVLAAASIEGAADKALESFVEAAKYDPQNPLYALLTAQLYSRTGDFANARAEVTKSIAKKNNYTDALFFLTQLDLNSGDIDAAIATTQAITSLEPNNPARFYQLGVLYSSAGDVDSAITAFERAVQLNRNYANARYFLALAYAQTDRTAEALEQLAVVQALNPNNQDVANLISQIQSGDIPSIPETAEAEQVNEPEPVVEDEDGIVTTDEAPDTPLITPVNPVAESSQEADSSSTEPATEQETSVE